MHLGEENKGVDASAVRFINWDRDVQEAVPPSNLNMKMVKSVESKRKSIWVKPECFACFHFSTRC